MKLKKVRVSFIFEETPSMLLEDIREMLKDELDGMLNTKELESIHVEEIE